MKKVAILGCENSHADGFLQYIKDNPELDVEVAGIYSDEQEPCERLSKQFDVPVLKSYDQCVGSVDGVIITARHGDNHYKYAKPYIASGIPMFIDKPATISEEEAVVFAKEIKQNNIRITGGSCCKYFDRVVLQKQMVQSGKYGKVKSAFFRAPMEYDSEYGGFYFYSQHMVQMICEIYGYYPDSVIATKNGDTVSVIINYNGFSVTGTFVEETYKYYCVANFENMTEAGECIFDNVFEKEFKEYFDVLFGAQQKCNLNDFFAPVYIMNALVRSINSGKTEKVNRMGDI